MFFSSFYFVLLNSIGYYSEASFENEKDQMLLFPHSLLESGSGRTHKRLKGSRRYPSLLPLLVIHQDSCSSPGGPAKGRAVKCRS